MTQGAKPQRPLLAVLVVLALLAAVAYWFWLRATPVAVADTLYGNVDIRSVSLAFRVGGRVAQVKVDEGAQVKAGQVLAQLDTEPLNNALRASQASVAALTARNALLHKGQRVEEIDQAKARIESAQAVLTEAELQLTRNRQLLAGGAVSQRMLDAAVAQRDQASAQLKVGQEQLRSLLRGFRVEEIAESDALLAQAKVSLDVAKLALQDATLQAPSDGVVLTRAIEPGSMVAAASPVLTLSLTQPVWVRAYVSETQLGQFGTGSKVLLSTDARPKQAYHGVVGFVSPTAEFTPKTVETADLRTALVYRLRVVVQDPDAQLRQGMPVSVRLAH